jgi:hypothetical protein
MSSSFERFGSVAAIMTGILSITYAVFFLFVTRLNEFVGTLGSWIVLGGTAFFAIAAYVALYQRFKEREAGFALFALLISGMAAFAMLQHGGYEAIQIIRQGAVSTAIAASSQVDPAGLATFGVIGVGSLLWGWMIVRTGVLPRNLGYLGILNAVLLIVLFLATVVNSQTLILISGGLTSVIVGPIWWIWIGRALGNQKSTVVAERAIAS